MGDNRPVKRPVVAISMYTEPASWGSWSHVPAALLPDRYVQAVRRGGGTAVLVPPLGIGDDATSLLGRVDGLIIAGGADVNPSRYGAEPHVATAAWRDDRDVSEFALLDAAEVLGLPVFGICRGMQVMAARAGGSLHQHVPDLVDSTRHDPGPGRYGSVEVKIEPDSRLAEVLDDSLTVPCHHHQSVDRHPGYLASAHAEDGILEAMESPGERFEVGVQWHPEASTDVRLFAALVQAAASYRAG